MSLTVTAEILAKTTSECLTIYRKNLPHMGSQSGRELLIDASKVTEGGLLNIKDIAESDGDGKTARAIESIIAARNGAFEKAVPNFKAFQAVLSSFLKHNLIDGWIYTTGAPMGKSIRNSSQVSSLIAIVGQRTQPPRFASIQFPTGDQKEEQMRYAEWKPAHIR